MVKCDECVSFDQWLPGDHMCYCKIHEDVWPFEADECSDFEYDPDEE